MTQNKKPPMRIRRRRTRGPEISGFGPLLSIALVGVSLFHWQVAVLFVVGLLPSIVLAFTGRGAYKSYKLQCVTCANLAGIMPFAAMVWAQPRAMYDVLLNPLNLLMMIGSAAIGYALVYIGPMVAAVVLQSMAQDKIKALNQQRVALLEAWGPEVLGDTEAKGEDPAWANKPRRGGEDSN
ncbi:MAG: hypothetical protein EP335_14395 [Alphaproteobacteria bacterium]|nr:MAG: hypothetical protein EP335_14395 [Alphaproteobacteria bacterium]